LFSFVWLSSLVVFLFPFLSVSKCRTFPICVLCVIVCRMHCGGGYFLSLFISLLLVVAFKMFVFLLLILLLGMCLASSLSSWYLICYVRVDGSSHWVSWHVSGWAFCISSIPTPSSDFVLRGRHVFELCVIFLWWIL
jgi:hypothetical protein